jgi:predicted nucleic acid-binding protein
LKIADALQDVHSLFLDTAPLVYYVEEHPNYLAVTTAVFDLVDADNLTFITSPVTLAECLIFPIRMGNTVVQQNFVDLILYGENTKFVSLNEIIAQQAAELRVRYNLELADAFQIATALVSNCDAFLTNDIRLQRVSEIRVLVIDQLEL